MPLPKRIGRYLGATYATLDERSLGAGRVALAVVLLADLVKRVPNLEAWYTNAGLLPNHTLLWSPTREHTLSFLFAASHGYEVAVGFAFAALAYFALLVGYKTKLAQILSFIAVTSLHGRVMFIQIGADVALSALVFWTLFLPLGRRFSVDSLLEKLRLLEGGRSYSVRPRGVLSLACFALLFQLAIVYLFNAWQKNGPMWQNGSLLHYALHIDALVTTLGARLRPLLTLELSSVLTYATRAGEALIPIAVFFPVFTGYARGVAAALVIALHAGFALLLNVGLFSLVMMAYTPFLLPGGFWDFLEARRSKRARDDAAPNAGENDDLAQGVRAIAKQPDELPRIVRGMPFGGVLAELLRLPFGSRVLSYLSASAVRRARRDHAVAEALEKRNEGRRERGAWPARLRVAAIAVALYVTWAQAAVENPVLPSWLKAPQPAWGAALVGYLQLYQGWNMFAPEAMRTDIALSVDAVTKAGRHVDPWNDFARPGLRPPRERIPARLGYDVYENSYFGRIAEAPAYHTAFGEWVLRYHRRTGRAEDEIVSFSAAMLFDESPPPGETEPRNPRKQVFLKWPPE